MEFPLNQMTIDPDYLNEVESRASVRILSDFYVFQRHSGGLVKALKRDIDRYGSIQAIPAGILQQYHAGFTHIFNHFGDLQADLQQQMNKNTKYLMELVDSDSQGSCIYELYRKKQDSLLQKIEFCECIHAFALAVEFCL